MVSTVDIYILSITDVNLRATNGNILGSIFYNILINKAQIYLLLLNL
jgi:hypothetical protein